MPGRAALSGIGLAVGLAWTAGLAAQAPSTEDDWPTVATATFDSVWTRVRDTHFDPDLGGVDWDGARSELRPRATETTTIEELRTILSDLLGRLGDSHFAILPATTARAIGGVQSAVPGDATPGLGLRWLDSELVVTTVSSGSPAEQAGIAPGWVLEGVAGVPVSDLVERLREGESGADDLDRWVPTAATSLLLGPARSTVELELRDATDAPRSLALERRAPAGQVVRFGNLPPLRLDGEYTVERVEGGMLVGYLRFNAWFPAVVSEIADAVEAFAEADGVIVDLRGNPGGVGGLVMGIGGHFLDERVSLGTMRTRDTTLDFVTNPRTVTDDGRRTRPLSSRLVILVDPLTGSTSEIFAGGLQAIGRATVIGERTAGQALPATTARLPSGDVLMHAVADFEDPNGRRLEGVGVAPDIPVSLSRAAFIADDDPVRSVAVRFLTQGP